MHAVRAWLGWFVFALVAQPHGDYQPEIEALTAQLARHPRDIVALLRRGELYRDHGRGSVDTNDLAAARADFQRVLLLRPQEYLAEMGLARLDSDQGAWTAALDRVDRVLSRTNTLPSAHLLRAEILVHCHQSAAAVAEYDQGLKLLHEPRPETYLARARAQLAASPTNVAPVLAGLDEGMSRLGPVPGLAQLALDLEIRQGNTDAALRRLDALAATSDRQETWLSRRGDLLIQAGRREAAKDAWNQALVEIDRLPERLRSTRAMRELRESLTVRLNDKFAGPPAGTQAITPVP